MSQIVGHISQVIGPVVDVYFEGTEAEMMLPSIHDALEIKRSNGKRLIVEVQQHIGENTGVLLLWTVRTACREE